MMNPVKKILFIFLCLALPAAASAQTKIRKTTGKKPVKVVKKTIPPAAETAAPTDAKVNDRPETTRDAAVKTNKREPSADKSQDVKKQLVSTHFYTFSRPEFETSDVSIEHDDAGRGQISFLRRGWDEAIVDPLEVSPAALERISNALKALDFFNSTENYQYEKDYSHLGNVTIKVREGGKERSVKFNWTQNKDAKALYDEYRKIGNQAIWIFDIGVARENQPLNSPGLLDSLDSMIRRDEISDVQQMLPLLQALSNDERLPLIARNHAAKLVKQAEKEKK